MSEQSEFVPAPVDAADLESLSTPALELRNEDYLPPAQPIPSQSASVSASSPVPGYQPVFTSQFAARATEEAAAARSAQFQIPIDQAVAPGTLEQAGRPFQPSQPFPASPIGSEPAASTESPTPCTPPVQYAPAPQASPYVQGAPVPPSAYRPVAPRAPVTPPPSGYWYPALQQQPSGNGMAIAALVLGICGLLLCAFGPVGLICGVLALILGIQAKNKRTGGNGVATGGIVTGVIASVFSLLMTALLVLAIIFAVTEDDSDYATNDSYDYYEEYDDWTNYDYLG